VISAIKRWMLKAKMPSKKAIKASGVNELKSIGIIYDATSESHRTKVSKWIAKWNGKKIATCGFYGHNLPLNNSTLPTYCFKDINWYDMPSGPAIDGFLKNEYDILILASTTVYPHMEYILANAKYKLAAGPSHPSTMSYLSIIIEGQDLDNPDNIFKLIVDAINKIAK
jgi:hypothetical protein